jgi:hypothetical protein
MTVTFSDGFRANVLPKKLVVTDEKSSKEKGEE